MDEGISHPTSPAKAFPPLIPLLSPYLPNLRLLLNPFQHPKPRFGDDSKTLSGFTRPFLTSIQPAFCLPHPANTEWVMCSSRLYLRNLMRAGIWPILELKTNLLIEYITGDRFSQEFIEKRRHSLLSYLERISRHPKLQQSLVLRKFLEAPDLAAEQEVFKAKQRQSSDGGGAGLGDKTSTSSTSTSGSSTMFENISDALLNAFTKVKKPDEKFSEYKEAVSKFEDSLIAIEKLGQRLLKQETGRLRENFQSFFSFNSFISFLF